MVAPELVGLRGRSISMARFGHGEWAPPQNEHVGAWPLHTRRVPGRRLGGGELHLTIGESAPFIPSSHPPKCGSAK